MGHMITLTRPDGGTIEAWLAEATNAAGAVIVLQEWWGLNDNMRAICDRFAAEGLTALAPDLYKGRVVPYGASDEAAHMMDNLDFPSAVHEDVAATRDYMSTKAQKVAVMGYCMGGALTIGALVHLKGLDAGVCFYGMPPRAFADPAHITVPLQGHFATQDDWVTPAVVAQAEAAMIAAGNTPEFYSYEADHAFCNSARPETYVPAAAELAWSRMVPFLKTKLCN